MSKAMTPMLVEGYFHPEVRHYIQGNCFELRWRRTDKLPSTCRDSFVIKMQRARAG